MLNFIHLIHQNCDEFKSNWRHNFWFIQSTGGIQCSKSAKVYVTIALIKLLRWISEFFRQSSFFGFRKIRKIDGREFVINSRPFSRRCLHYFNFKTTEFPIKYFEIDINLDPNCSFQFLQQSSFFRFLKFKKLISVICGRWLHSYSIAGGGSTVQST